MASRKADNKADKSSGMPDRIKWFSSIAILVLAISGFYYWPDYSWLLRLIGLLIAFGIAGGIILRTTQGQFAWNAVKEARMEVRKVIWPTRKETMQTTMIVISVVFIMAVMLWALDGLLGLIMRYLLRQTG
uniref:Protein translocase subunit SecE n=1 Tax=Candidatus Kentrum sp. TUN TaxID=2126343 RepID=A0A450ZQP4_9GAMM|nr:MAG: preprotein translocase subunit SecE [Candidatus Kentron sp. TUN]VFK56149.1 MAG: preprotein translocase subunit SecE [Candidatus Kentron sp. TUN]VFK56346.1 MAG: preprotein translocase subunit SecE [Candidatus Kentron sp. TUN]